MMKAAAALVTAGVLLAGACTNTEPAEGGSDNGDSSAGDSTGVTDDTIRVGWPTLDQAALVEAGLATDFGDITTIAQAMVADWNEGDGINGRQVELVELVFGTDPTNLLADMQRLCLELTEDEEVFATAAYTWFGDAVTCLAGDHDTPLLTQSSQSQTVFDTGKGNIFLANFLWEDALRSAVVAVDESGDLAEAEKIGVFGTLEPGIREAVDDGLAPALEEAGTEIAEDGMIPFGAPVDNAAVAAVVSRFKSEGVDTVFAVGNFYINGAFMTEAEQQGFRPTYIMSDLSEGTDDLVLKFAPPEQLEKAIGASWKGKSPDPVSTEAGQDCLTNYAPNAESVTQQIGASQTCELLEILRQGLEGAGDSPTRGSFLDALADIGSFTTSGGGEGSFSTDKQTMPDQARLVRFDLDGCGCWVSDGDWVDVYD